MVIYKKDAISSPLPQIWQKSFLLTDRMNDNTNSGEDEGWKPQDKRGSAKIIKHREGNVFIGRRAMGLLCLCLDICVDPESLCGAKGCNTFVMLLHLSHPSFLPLSQHDANVSACTASCRVKCELQPFSCKD